MSVIQNVFSCEGSVGRSSFPSSLIVGIIYSHVTVELPWPLQADGWKRPSGLRGHPQQLACELLTRMLTSSKTARKKSPGEVCWQDEVFYKVTILGATSHHLCHLFLLLRNKSQIPPTFKEERLKTNM